MQITLRDSNFEEIEHIWVNHLWPKRKSPVKAISPISFDLKYDASIKNSEPIFYVAESTKREIAGVISGFRTSEALYRSRGLYVFPQFRKLGISQILLQAIKNKAENERCAQIWTLPRQTAWPAYEKFGFQKVSDWLTNDMEFGPNCIAIYPLSHPSKFDKTVLKS